MSTWPTFRFPDPKTGPETWVVVKHPRDRKAPDVAQRSWYLRPPAGHPSAKAWHSLGTADEKEAILRARTFLHAFSGGTDRHLRAQADLAGPGKQTFTDLAAAWAEAGYPDNGERPREVAAAARMAGAMKRTLVWWGPQNAALVTSDTIREFARARRGMASRNRGQTGDRVIDVELAALSCLCQWAVAVRRLEKNPFQHRPRFRRPEDVEHCNEFRPANDEELHAILAWLWSPTQPLERVVAGAELAWCALTGQRPGESSPLRVDTRAIGDNRPPGTRWAVRDGSERIAVARDKRGINPAIRVHPALADFLEAWMAYRAQRWPTSPWYWPNPACPSKRLNNDRLGTALEAAVKALGLPERHPHAMRAFYVRVRRSDGIADGQVAVELGQGGGAALIPKTYGRADDILGDGAFDWLPQGPDGLPTTPAWQALRAATPANVIPIHKAA